MAPAPLLLLLKAHNKGYVKKDGTVVKPFTDKRPTAAAAPPASPPPSSKPKAPPAAATPAPGPKPPPSASQQALQDELFAEQSSSAPPKKAGKWSAIASIASAGKTLFSKKPSTGLFGGFMAPDHAKDLGQKPLGSPSQHKPLPASAVAHPRPGDKGETVMIHYPSKPTSPDTWTDPNAIATWTPGAAVPPALNGVAFGPWDAPSSEEGWDYVVGQNDELEEPGMELPAGKAPASGVIVMEPDGRVWVVAPTNRFGAVNTFPKGGREVGLSLQANAIKEAYEESGLQVEIDSFLGDVVRSTSVARYYLARRVGGTPAAMGWESQAVRLVPAAQLRDFMDRGEDKKVAEWLEGLA